MINWRTLTSIPSAIERYSYGRGKHRRTSLKIQDVFNKAKRNAKRRNIEWFLLPEEFVLIWRDDCELCGIAFSVEERWITRSIDRIDAAKGYEKGNVRMVCFGCNAMRALSEINSRRKKPPEEPWL